MEMISDLRFAMTFEEAFWTHSQLQ